VSSKTHVHRSGWKKIGSRRKIRSQKKKKRKEGPPRPLPLDGFKNQKKVKKEGQGSIPSQKRGENRLIREKMQVFKRGKCKIQRKKQARKKG